MLFPLCTDVAWCFCSPLVMNPHRRSSGEYGCDPAIELYSTHNALAFHRLRSHTLFCCLLLTYFPAHGVRPSMHRYRCLAFSPMSLLVRSKNIYHVSFYIHFLAFLLCSSTNQSKKAVHSLVCIFKRFSSVCFFIRTNTYILLPFVLFCCIRWMNVYFS